MGDDFKNWLMAEKGLEDRSARSVVCRLKRASSFIVINEKIPVSHSIFLLSESDEYKLLTGNVRSQLKRAVALHYEFLAK